MYILFNLLIFNKLTTIILLIDFYWFMNSGGGDKEFAQF